MSANKPQQNICDARGHQCPIPVLKARKELARLAKGQQLTLLATDPMAKLDVPHMCNEQGYTLISSKVNEDDVLTFVIEI